MKIEQKNAFFLSVPEPSAHVQSFFVRMIISGESSYYSFAYTFLYPGALSYVNESQ